LLSAQPSLGEHFLKGLKNIQESHKLVGHVDGLGLWLRMELVKDRKTKEPTKKENVMLQKRYMKDGVPFLVEGYYHNVIKIHPH